MVKAIDRLEYGQPDPGNHGFSYELEKLSSLWACPMALGLSHAVELRGSLLWQTECNISEQLYEGCSMLETQRTRVCVCVCGGVGTAKGT